MKPMHSVCGEKIKPFKALFTYPSGLGKFKQTDEFKKWVEQVTETLNHLSSNTKTK